ncbi:MAG: hypothetical protein JXA67_19325 [Micromonosporaceae bacterium]|nr:hypothetical protein [Micromonosporaceae bacterium]
MSGTNLLLLLFAVAAAATGQLLLKHGMQLAVKQSEHDGSLIACAATSPWVLGGLGIFGISAIAWLSTLARVPLSVAYPFNALGYLGILAASVLVLHEKASIWTWAGTTLVASGLVIVVLTSP